MEVLIFIVSRTLLIRTFTKSVLVVLRSVTSTLNFRSPCVSVRIRTIQPF
jgi:hypothetical protein